MKVLSEIAGEGIAWCDFSTKHCFLKADFKIYTFQMILGNGQSYWQQEEKGMNGDL